MIDSMILSATLSTASSAIHSTTLLKLRSSMRLSSLPEAASSRCWLGVNPFRILIKRLFFSVRLLAETRSKDHFLCL